MSNSKAPQYVPILKSKRGEFGALRELASNTRHCLTPLIDVVRMPIDKRDQPIDGHLDKIAENIRDSWGMGRPIFYDVKDLPLDTRTSTGEHPLVYLGERLIANEIEAIPTIGLDRDDYYIQATHRMCLVVKSVLLRLEVDDITLPNELSVNIQALLNEIEVQPSATHILIDLGSIRDNDANATAETVLGMLRSLESIQEYASVVVAGSSMPQGLSELVHADTTALLPRNEWDIWQLLQAMPSIPRNLGYGDYGVVHPDMLDLDPRRITLGAAIRYTTNNDVLVIRGRAIKSHPDGFGQFYTLAETLVDLPDYRGSSFSWGDSRIYQCAQRQCGTGNLETWVKVGTNHHLTHVIDQLGL
ncbi:MAG: beta family protein [Deltaproteobacteria bacterium]|nr:beta family protein [Deltaproteobacteria bacterium]